MNVDSSHSQQIAARRSARASRSPRPLVPLRPLFTSSRPTAARGRTPFMASSGAYHYRLPAPATRRRTQHGPASRRFRQFLRSQNDLKVKAEAARGVRACQPCKRLPASISVQPAPAVRRDVPARPRLTNDRVSRRNAPRPDDVTDAGAARLRQWSGSGGRGGERGHVAGSGGLTQRAADLHRRTRCRGDPRGPERRPG